MTERPIFIARSLPIPEHSGQCTKEAEEGTLTNTENMRAFPDNTKQNMEGERWKRARNLPAVAAKQKLETNDTRREGAHQKNTAWTGTRQLGGREALVLYVAVCNLC